MSEVSLYLCTSSGGCLGAALAVTDVRRFRANVAHSRQSRADYGLGCRAEVLTKFLSCSHFVGPCSRREQLHRGPSSDQQLPLHLGRWRSGRCSGRRQPRKTPQDSLEASRERHRPLSREIRHTALSCPHRRCVTTTNPQSWIKSTFFFLWEFLYSSPESGDNGSNSHWN